MNDLPRGRTPEERVQALLGDLGSEQAPEPMPDDVAARLEETLAGLTAERTPQHPTAGSAATDRSTTGSTVVPLHRRWGPRLAVAAAAVVVLGVGGVAVSNLGLLDDSGGTSAGSTADSAGGEAGVEQAPEALPAPALSSTSFAADATALLRRTPALAAPPGAAARERSRALLPPPECPGPEQPRAATRTLVRLDGEPAVLLVRPERAGRRLVQAWTCDGARTLASARLSSGTLSP